MIEWLKTKDPNEQYRWNSSLHCAIAQFVRTKVVNTDRIIAGGFGNYYLGEGYGEAVEPTVESEKVASAARLSKTFGELLEKLEAANG